MARFQMRRDESLSSCCHPEGVPGLMASNTKILALALGVLTASTVALSQSESVAAGSPVASSPRIGIVGLQEAIAATNDGQKEMDALQKRFAPKQTELKALNDELENLKKQFQARGDKISDEERANQGKALEIKQKTLQRNYEDYQNEAQQAEAEVLSRLSGKMLSVLKKYASTNGYSVILDASNQQSPVLWFSNTTNITKQLVDAYNAEAPLAPSPKPKPAGSAGAAVRKPAGSAAPAKRP
jgi:outer membrane protein